MKMILLRVGIDTGSGGIHGPLFSDGSFEFIPIPDKHNIDERTYGQTTGRYDTPFNEYFPVSKRMKMRGQSMHVDPEFGSFTYGDPNRNRAGLAKLETGDMLVFYCGLEGWDHHSDPHLYLCGYFEVQTAGRAMDYSEERRQDLFGENFHVHHDEIFKEQRDGLVLVKGGSGSRLLNKAVQISSYEWDSAGNPLKVLSPAMHKVFGDLGGKNSLQRGATRTVKQNHVEKAAAFVRSLD